MTLSRTEWIGLFLLVLLVALVVQFTSAAPAWTTAVGSVMLSLSVAALYLWWRLALKGPELT